MGGCQSIDFCVLENFMVNSSDSHCLDRIVPDIDTQRLL